MNVISLDLTSDYIYVLIDKVFFSIILLVGVTWDDTYVTTKSGTAVSASSAKKSTDQVAREVIQGLWGNGADRTNRLKVAGYDPSVIQNRVNQLLK